MLVAPHDIYVFITLLTMLCMHNYMQLKNQYFFPDTLWSQIYNIYLIKPSMANFVSDLQKWGLNFCGLL